MGLGQGFDHWSRVQEVTDGTLVGDAAWADAKFGKGIYFDGNDDGLSFADLDELDAPREFAISIWFKREADVTGQSTNHGIDNGFFFTVRWIQ